MERLHFSFVRCDGGGWLSWSCWRNDRGLLRLFHAGSTLERLCFRCLNLSLFGGSRRRFLLRRRRGFGGRLGRRAIEHRDHSIYFNRITFFEFAFGQRDRKSTS